MVDRRLASVALGALVAVSLAGCDTFGLQLPGAGARPAPPIGRPLDFRNDDLADVVFAVDVPTSLKPVPGASIATFDAASGKAQRHVKATLTLADGDAVDQSLPPPAPGRTYYLLGFSPKDGAALRQTQKWLRALPPDAAPVTVLQIVPRLCSEGPVDPAAVKVALLPALAGAGPLAPLLAPEPLSRLLADTDTTLKRCGGR